MNEDQPRVPAGSPEGGEFTGYRHGAATGPVTFYSKQKDYAEEYAVTRGGRPQDVVKETFHIHKPHVVEATPRQFSDPAFEKPHIEHARQTGHDAVIFRQGQDEFVARLK